MKWVYLCEFFSIMPPGVSRIAYASLLLGILPPIKWRSRMLWTLIWIQFVVDVGTVIISFVQCRPINKFWDAGVPGHCWAPTVQQYVGFFQGSKSPPHNFLSCIIYIYINTDIELEVYVLRLTWFSRYFQPVYCGI